MNRILVIFFFVLAIVYILSPYDLLPDFFPFLGWIDDTAVLAVLFYYMRNGKLPDFLTRIFRGASGASNARYSRTNPGGYGDSRQETEQPSGTQEKDPYSILGVKPGASKDEIHSAYRHLVHQYHPDKVSHLGAEFQEMARQKFVEIQSAYDALTGKRT